MVGRAAVVVAGDAPSPAGVHAAASTAGNTPRLRRRWRIIRRNEPPPVAVAGIAPARRLRPSVMASILPAGAPGFYTSADKTAGNKPTPADKREQPRR